MNQTRISRENDTDRSVEGGSAVFDEKSGQPSIASSESFQSREQEVPSQLGAQEKDLHVTSGNDTTEETNDVVLEPVRSKRSVRDASSIPDGGLWAWLQVLGGFFLLFNSW
jgi:hypothetical protein